MDSVLNVLNNLDITNQDYVVLACSYGPDSMCLLDLLIKRNLNIVVAHVNHKLREESDKEYTELKDYCKKNKVIFEGAIIDSYPKGNIESYARKFRYDFFKEIVKKYNAKYLFTAHHGDDLVETVLMRLSRGSSFRGYGGFNINTKLDGYILCRPLIYLTKDEIMEYVKENNIPYAIDSSNLSDDYTRNRYRHDILPILKDINPSINKKVLKFSQMIFEYNDYLEEEIDSLYSKLYINNRLDLNEYNLLPIFIKKCLLRKILSVIYGDDINLINDNHLDLLLDLTNNDKANSMVNLPNKVIVSKYYNIIEFGYHNNIDTYDIILDDYLIKDNWSIKRIDTTDIIKSNYLIRLDSNEIKLPLHIRTRLTGDKMTLKNGTKKVGEILSEAKLSKKERDMYPIVCDSDNNILWIPGIKKSKFDKQKQEGYDIILKYVKKGEKNEEK